MSATTAAVIAAIGSLVSATMAMITVLGRRPKVTASIQRGVLSQDGYFIGDDAGHTVAVATVNERDLPIEVESVWLEPRTDLIVRVKIALIDRKLRRGAKAIFPRDTQPNLPRTVAGRHRVVLRFAAGPVQEVLRTRADKRVRALVRLSDDRLARTKWISLDEV